MYWMIKIIENLYQKLIKIFSLVEFQKSNYQIKNIRLFKEYSKFDLSINLPNKKQKQIKNFIIPLIGLHNIRNSVAAIAVASTIGLSNQNIKNGLKNFKRNFEDLIKYLHLIK